MERQSQLPHTHVMLAIIVMEYLFNRFQSLPSSLELLEINQNQNVFITSIERKYAENIESISVNRKKN